MTQVRASLGGVVASALERPFLCPELIGRDSALGILDTRLRAAAAGSGQTVLVSSEAGIGKTRLVRELAEKATARDIQVLFGNCFEQDRGLPYGPIIDLLRKAKAPHGHADLTKAPEELLALLPEQALVGLQDDPEHKKRHLFASMVRWLSTRAREQPLLTIIEDLHWCDDVSLELLLLVARSLGSQPSLLLLTYRGDEVHPSLRHFLATLDRERSATEIELGGLPKPEIGRCIRAILGVASPPRQDLIDSLFSLTEGNPFYLEEVLKSLIQRGDLLYVGGEWQRRSPVGFKVPRSVQDVVQQRLASLEPATRSVLSVGAVAGQRFDTATLQRVAGLADDVLLEVVRQLVAAQFLVEESDEGFAFRHALTREAIYTSLLALERRRMHRAWASAIEQGLAPESRSEALAYHWFEAQDWVKALRFGALAAERARQLHSPRAVVVQLTRALEAALRLGQPASFSMLRQRGQANETIGEFDAALGDLEAALAACREAGEPAQEWQASLDLGALWASRNYARAGDFYRRALDLAKADGDKGRLGKSLNRLGNWHANVGHPAESQECHLNALNLFKSMADAEGEADTRDLLGMVNTVSGDNRAAVEHYRQAIPFFRKQGNQEGLASSLTSISLRAGVYQNDAAPPIDREMDCLADGEEALKIARAIGWRSGEAFALWQNASVLASLGRYTLALRAAGEGLAIAEEIDHRQWTSAAHFILGSIYTDLFLPQEALAHLDRAVALAKEVDSHFWIGLTVGRKLALLAQTGQLAEGERLLKESLPPDAPMDTLGRRAIWISAADLRVSSGDALAARDIAVKLQETSPEAAAGAVIPRVWLLLGRALTVLGRQAEAETALVACHDALQQTEQRRMLWRVQSALTALYTSGRQLEKSDRAAAAARDLGAAVARDISEGVLRDAFLAGVEATLPARRNPTPQQAAKRESGGLTAREREVATLVAQGMSNRAIAEQLVVSERTVESHVASIMSKLDLNSRAHIAAWATSKGLAPHS